jgi:SAM-dependent methyltransferase
MSTAAFWDRIAESYAAKPLPNPESTRAKLDILRTQIAAGHRVVDVGCGTGTIVLRLADTGAELHGLDISPDMVRIARGKAVDQGADPERFQVGSFDSDRFDPGSLDAVLAFNIVHLVTDVDAALEHAFRWLRPGGLFAQAIGVLGESWMPWSLFIGAARLVGKAPDHIGIFTRDDLFARMRRVGFEDIEVHEVGGGKMAVFVTARRPA